MKTRSKSTHERAREILPPGIWRVLQMGNYAVHAPYWERFRWLTWALADLPVSPLVAPMARRRGVEVRPLVAFDDYASSAPDGFELRFREPAQLHYARPRFDDQPRCTEPGDDLEGVQGPSRYGAVLPDASAIGGSSLVQLDDGRVLYDLPSHDARSRYRYTDGASRHVDKKRCLLLTAGEHPPLEEAICLVGNFSWNLYHLLYEVMIKLPQIDARGLPQDVPLLVDAVVAQVPAFRRMLDMLNRAGRPVVFLEARQRCRVGRLHVLSAPNFIPPNMVVDRDMGPSDTCFDRAALQALRDAMLAAVAPSAGADRLPRRVFLSRRKASGRRHFNEAEVLDVLQGHGFVEVFPEDLSLDDQIALFARAEMIAGGSGAAFTNLLFCQRGCRALVFAKTDLPASVFSTIAAHVGAELRYLTAAPGELERLHDFHAPFELEPARVQAVMSLWGQGQPA